ncbi:DUF4326 domain-containing protein [Saccharopolyspora soli]|uniref:DUF4326 domain-containing protein n=1 Tax=Saccharopolyspora soli TaxID=2926618 RepID=UPI003555D5BA
MTPARRVQRRRRRGWRKPPGAIIVDRTSRYGNPFTVAAALATGAATTVAEAHQWCRDRYRQWLVGADPRDADVMVVGRTAFDRRWVRAHLHHLRGRTLCCSCPPRLACHADVLADLAERPPATTAGAGHASR